MNVEIVPLISLPTEKFDLDYMNDFDNVFPTLLRRNYENVINLTHFHGFHRLSELSLNDLQRAISLHLDGLSVEESMPLFGGYGFKVNGVFVLLPQCCGLMSEINSIKTMLDSNFCSFYLSEQHPAPQFMKYSNAVKIICDNSYEDFMPETQKEILLDYSSLVIAIKKLLHDLDTISKNMNQLNHKFATNNLAHFMIWNDE